VRYYEGSSVSGTERPPLEVLVNFARKINEKVKYEDYVLDFCSNSSGLTVIEINTPFYLFGGIHLCSYRWYLDKIHNSKPVFMQPRGNFHNMDQQTVN
jgi:hypothetical protein